MQRFGEVSKSYVAKKRDKSGNRFGFIPFMSIRDWKELEKKINGVNMGGFKLKVNVARFAVENSGLEREPERKFPFEGEPMRKSRFVSQGVGSTNHDGLKSFGHRDVRSYRDVVHPMTTGIGSSGSEKRVDKCRSKKVVEVSDAVRAFEELHWKAVVGRTADLDTLIYFDRLLRISKVNYEKI
ncbi:putative nucleotide-binding alpha-beta plait domain superfamily, RNA-binding domain superfamily [Helianthus annuus]|nr:putative nucleotide-binding alpha-beta plait domain superfamily, RNA-binding domain superfamily [Helianthus annuus]KAJ0631224.1 putative nucleotide-binding alpha-beta plait domain superfamily, RNA-binding domain superfamily [Helianthus annuus]KAJ0635098.1 putative nucleotide-binding alpha-beta plait domain superfamily, RNA-binding domain superfamily [Helianthus annuus]